MRYILLSFFLTIPQFYCFSQVITTLPTLPKDKQEATIYFNADNGDKGLIGFINEIYAHTGVITDKSTSISDWKYVKSPWDINNSACLLTRISTNEYQLKLLPNIRDFYGVPIDEKISSLAFVFRSSDGSITGRDDGGKDIFVRVFEEGINVSFAKPSGLFSLVDSSQEILIEINASEHDSIQLFINNQYIKSSTSSSLTYSAIASNPQKYTLIAKAYKNTSIVTDTTYYIVKGTTQTSSLPMNFRDGISYPDNQSATFIIYAPYKKNIYLVGDFNQWIPDNSYLMKKDNDRF